jgi:hypothetical protein
VIRRAVAALVFCTGLATPASASAATMSCSTALRSESRVALSGSFLTVTGSMYWRDCAVTSGAAYDAPAKFQLAYVWQGNPHCGRIWGGFTGLSWNVTVLDDAPRSYRVTGSIPCHKNGIGWAEVSLAGAPRLAESLNDRWVSKVVVHYKSMPDPSVTLRGGF